MAFFKRKNKELFLYENLTSTKNRKKEYLPLWEAILVKEENAIEVFLGLGADPEQKCPLQQHRCAGYTFLHSAAMWHDFLNDNHTIAEIFIRYIGNVNEKPLLRLAISSGNTQCADLLLKNGAKLKGFALEGISLAYGIGNNIDRTKMLHLLFNHCIDVNYRDEGGANLLHLLAKHYVNNDIVEIAETLLKCGVPLNELTNVGYSPLVYAVNYDNYKLAAHLIKKGIDVNLKCIEGYNALFCAVAHGRENFINLLLSHGADVNARESNGTTPLHYACHYQPNKIIKVLLMGGADVTARDRFGRTPFSQMSLDDPEKIFSSVYMLTELARLSFENTPLCESDIDSIRLRPILQDVFEESKKELLQMSKKIFYSHYSYYSVLKMSKNIKKLANLTENEEFVKNFFTNLSFEFYKYDLKKIMEEAIKVKEHSLVVFSRLNSIFVDFLPEAVIRVLSKNLKLEDLPLEDNL